MSGPIPGKTRAVALRGSVASQASVRGCAYLATSRLRVTETVCHPWLLQRDDEGVE
jgi:hypothetical protein